MKLVKVFQIIKIQEILKLKANKSAGENRIIAEIVKERREGLQ